MRDDAEARSGRFLETFLVFLKLGLTCFGGPIAHLGYFRAEFVERRKWIDEAGYADLVALCQFLPGPASSQTGFAIGLGRAGWGGGLAAWLGFTAPSAILMMLFAYGADDLGRAAWGVGLLHGLKLAAVAIVAQAVFGMAKSLCPDKQRASIAVCGLAVVLLLPNAFAQIGAIALGGLAGLAFCASGEIVVARERAGGSRTAGIVCLVLFFVGLGVSFVPSPPGMLALFDAFYRSGALVFGGGHVVLPLLRSAVVAPGWVSDSLFLAGYGGAQALPGPLFTFAAYLGALARAPTATPLGGLAALIAIFLPGILVVSGALPFWNSLRRQASARAAMAGVNAAVVGLLGAAFYNPVWTSSVATDFDVVVAVGGFVLLTAWRAPPLIVVSLAALSGLLSAH